MFGGAPPPSHRRGAETNIRHTTEEGHQIDIYSGPEGNSGTFRTQDQKVRVHINEQEFQVNEKNGRQIGLGCLALAGGLIAVGYYAHQLFN